MLPCRATTGGGARQLDTFLGVLYLVQDYKVYGYVTNTGVRFVLVIDDQDNKDGRFFHCIYKNYSHMYNMYAACIVHGATSCINTCALSNFAGVFISKLYEHACIVHADNIKCIY